MKKRDQSYYSPAKWAEMQAAELKQEAGDRLQEMKSAGVKRVEWLSADDGSECQHCRKMNGQRLRIEDVTFTEHPDCEHPRGCRCILIAVSNLDPDEDEEY